MAIRAGRSDDLARVKAIYDHYVLTSHATFDIEPPPLSQWEGWFADEVAKGEQLFFAAEDDGDVLAWVKTESFRSKAAYATSRYTTIYCDERARGRGFGTALYERLFDKIGVLGLHRVYAAIALPNDASIALHERFGYARAGTYTQCGRKFDRYWDVATYEKSLG